MLAYIIRRLLLIIPTLLGILLINFIIVQAEPYSTSLGEVPLAASYPVYPPDPEVSALVTGFIPNSSKVASRRATNRIGAAA